MEGEQADKDPPGRIDGRRVAGMERAAQDQHEVGQAESVWWERIPLGQGHRCVPVS